MNKTLALIYRRCLLVKPPELTNWDSTFIDRENTFTEELKRIPNVVGASTSWNRVGGETGRSFNMSQK